MLILIWHWLSTQIDCEWDWSTTNFTRSLIKLTKQNLLFVVISWLGTPPYGEKQKTCVYGLGFGRKRPNPRPSPNYLIAITLILFSVDDFKVQRFDENVQISSLKTKNQIISSNHFIKRISIMWDILNDSKNDLYILQSILSYDDA